MNVAELEKYVAELEEYAAKQPQGTTRIVVEKKKEGWELGVGFNRIYIAHVNGEEQQIWVRRKEMDGKIRYYRYYRLAGSLKDLSLEEVKILVGHSSGQKIIERLGLERASLVPPL